MATKWKLVGTYFETCNCETLCPCLFLSPPTMGECNTLAFWHIDKGNFNHVALDGLNVAMAIHCPGHMAQVKWKVALYLDARAAEAQKDALTQIFTGQVGGHLATLVSSFVGELLGIKSVTMDYRAEGKRRSFRIPHVVAADIEAFVSPSGDEATIGHTPLCVSGQPGVVARSTRVSYHDHGLQWELSAKHGFFSPFTYQA